MRNTPQDAIATIEAMFKAGLLKMPTRAQQRKANRTGRPVKIAEVSLNLKRTGRRPPVRRERAPAIRAPRARNRAPCRRRSACVKDAESRAGPNGDPDPEPRPLTAVPTIQTPESGLGRHGRAAAMSSKVARFPLRAVAAVLICQERNSDAWLALVGDHGWLFGSLAEARRAARWLARNRGLPIRELIGGAVS
jgi:hypothetical protein